MDRFNFNSIDDFSPDEFPPCQPSPYDSFPPDNQFSLFLLANQSKNNQEHRSGLPLDDDDSYEPYMPSYEPYTPNVTKRLDALQELQKQHKRLDAMFLARKAELEAKFQKLYQPLSTKRFEIVNGVAEVDTPNDSSNNKGVPGFWLTALKSSKPIAGMISKADEGTLNYLKDIKWCRIVKPKGFKLEFFFNRNPYFKDLILTKAYHVEERRYEYVLKDILGTEIQWSITRTKTRKSFFDFFTPPKPLADGDYDEDRVRASASRFDWDYKIGCIIRNKIIPHAVKRFMGEVNDHGEDGCL